MTVSDYKLDQLRLGELDEAEEQEVLTTLEQAGELGRLDALFEAADEYHRHFPPEVAIAEVRENRRRVARNQPRKKQMAPRPFATLGTLGVALVVLAGWWALDQKPSKPAPAETTAAARSTEAHASIEQLYVEAERHDREGDTAVAANLYGRIADEHALAENPGVYLQSVLRRGLYEHAKSDPASEERFERVVELHAALEAPPALGTDAAAQAQFMLAEQDAVATVSESLNEEDEATLKGILERKSRAGYKADNALQKVIAYGRPRWSIAAYTRIGTLQRAFADSIRSSAMPERLTATQREEYREVLDRSARKVEQNAIDALEKAIALSEDEGITTADTGAARVALAQLQSNELPTDDGATSPDAQTESLAQDETPQKIGKKLSRSDVKKTITPLHSTVRKCAELDGPGGTVKVKFYIQPSGEVRDAEIVSSRHMGTPQGDCVLRAVAELKFPTFEADKPVPVTYPFILPKKTTKPRGDGDSSQSKSAEELQRRAMSELLKGGNRRAIKLAKQAIDKGCTSKCYRLLGMAHHKLGESADACRWFEKAGSELPEKLECD